jgi:selenide,water dikinase
MVDIRIHTLPIIKYMNKIDKVVHNFKLKEGISAETSGGLFICIDPAKARDLMQELSDKG